MTTRLAISGRSAIRTIAAALTALLLMLSLASAGAHAGDALIPLVDTGGSGGSEASDATSAALSQNLQSIALIEGKGVANPPLVVAPSQNERSVQMVESLYAEGGVLAGGDDPTDEVVTSRATRTLPF